MDFDLFFLCALCAFVGLMVGLLIGIRIGWKAAVDYIDASFPELGESRKEEK